LTSGIIVI